MSDVKGCLESVQPYQRMLACPAVTASSTEPASVGLHAEPTSRPWSVMQSPMTFARTDCRLLEPRQKLCSCMPTILTPLAQTYCWIMHPGELGSALRVRQLCPSHRWRHRGISACIGETHISCAAILCANTSQNTLAQHVSKSCGDALLALEQLASQSR